MMREYLVASGLSMSRNQLQSSKSKEKPNTEPRQKHLHASNVRFPHLIHPKTWSSLYPHKNLPAFLEGGVKANLPKLKGSATIGFGTQRHTPKFSLAGKRYGRMKGVKYQRGTINQMVKTSQASFTRASEFKLRRNLEAKNRPWRQESESSLKWASNNLKTEGKRVSSKLSKRATKVWVDEGTAPPKVNRARSAGSKGNEPLTENDRYKRPVKLRKGKLVSFRRSDYIDEMKCDVDYPSTIDEEIHGILYEPPSHLGPPQGIVVCVPGSLGGLGPGITQGTPKTLDKASSFGVHGSIYIRLGLELSNCCSCSWDWKKEENAKWSDKSVSGMPVAVLQIEWSFKISGYIRLKPTLVNGVNDVSAAVRYMCKRFKLPSAVLIGNSFGGPAVWGASAHLPREIVTGLVTFAGSARGGKVFADHKLGTLEAARDFKRPTLILQGTHDKNVALPISVACYQACHPDTSTLVVVNGGEHIFANKRTLSYPYAKRFVLQTLFPTKTVKHLQTGIITLTKTKEGVVSKPIKVSDIKTLKCNKYCAGKTRAWFKGSLGERRPKRKKKKKFRIPASANNLCGYIGYSE